MTTPRCLPVILSVVLAVPADLAVVLAETQVTPRPADSPRPPAPSGAQGVTPLPSRPQTGRVTPLPSQPDAGGATEIVAVGVSTVFNGNATAARLAALQSAYAEAVGRGAGIDVGRLTLVRNVRAVTDVVAARSRGFVKSYEVLGESLRPTDPPTYEVRIRAVVSTSTQTADDIESLKLFLDVIGRPTLLVMLPDSEVPEQGQSDRITATTTGGTTTIQSSANDAPTRPPTPGLTALGGDAQVAGAVRSAEAALAQAFARYGYSVLTSDDVRATTGITSEQLTAARRGVTTAAMAVARVAGADLLVTGLLRVSTQRVTPETIEFVSATTEASAKALVVSNGYVVDAFHRTVTKAHPSTLGAVSATLDAVASELSSGLAWKLPSILSAQPRVTRIHLDRISLDMAQKVKAALEKLDGIDAVRFATIPTASKPEAVLEILSSYVVLAQDELVMACALAIGQSCQVLAADKFALRLSIA